MELTHTPFAVKANSHTFLLSHNTPAVKGCTHCWVHTEELKGHLWLGCATHLLSEQSVIGTSSPLLLLSRRLQLPSKLSWPDQCLSHITCH